MNKTISVVVPVFRNKGSIRITYEEIKGIFTTLLPGYYYEFVFVNDGSDDGSLDEILEIHKQDPAQVRVISFSANFGQMAAVIAGFRKATGDMCVLISADLQDPPELIAQMVKAGESGEQIVICNRIHREDNFLTTLSSWAFYSVMRLADKRIPRGGFDFVMMGRKAVNTFNALGERNRFFQGDVLSLGFPAHFIPYSRKKRTVGMSQWTVSKKLKYFADALLSITTLPVKLIWLTGTAITTLGFVYGILSLCRLADKIPSYGYALLITLIFIIGVVIIIPLAVIAGYLMRHHYESRKRPAYIIDKEF